MFDDNCTEGLYRIKGLVLQLVKGLVIVFWWFNTKYNGQVINLTHCYFAASYLTDQDDVIYEEKSDRAMMRQLPAEDRAKIQVQVEEFRVEKVGFSLNVFIFIMCYS